MSGLRETLTHAFLQPPPPRPAAPTVGTFGAPGPKIPERSTIVGARAVVAVVGLAPGCGATTVARALAAALARRDHSGVAIVATAAAAPGSALAIPAASRLANRLGGAARGRLCITSAEPSAYVAPLVLDVPHGAAPSLVPNVTVLVADEASEPSLARLAAQTQAARDGRAPITVVNRATESDRWAGRAFAHLPPSRTAAWLAAAGWEPRGAFGAAIAKLAGACEEAACA